MATLNNVKEMLAQLLDIPVSALERHLRALREAGYTPAGRPGGGIGAAHYGRLPLAYVLLGLAAGRHSDAPEAVRRLRQLPCRGVQDAPSVADALPTLEDQVADPALADQLASWIAGLAVEYQKRMLWTQDIVAKAKTWQMQLSEKPCHAIIKFGPRHRTVYVYAEDQISTPVLRRFTVLTGEVLLATAELLVDTETHQTTLNAVTFLGETKPTKALAHRTNSAGHFSTKEAPALRNDQPRDNEADRLTTLSDSKRVCTLVQVGHPVKTITGDPQCGNLMPILFP